MDLPELPDLSRELVSDLGRLHDGIDRVGPIADLALEEIPAPDDWPAELGARGVPGAVGSALDLGLVGASPATRRGIANAGCLLPW